MSKKGKAKNTVNKAKHTKLIKQKVLRITEQKKQHKLRLKEIIKIRDAQKFLRDAQYKP